MTWPQPGIHERVPFELYRSDDITQADTIQTATGKAVSKSLIINFMPDPSAWKAAPPKKPSAAMKAGSLFDTLLTEPDKLNVRFIESEYDEFRTKESKQWRAEMEAAGMIVVKADAMQLARDQFAAVTAKPEAMALIHGSRKQVAFRHRTKYAFDSKGLIDIVPSDPDTLVDIKTCEPSALESRRNLSRHIMDWSYHIQAGAYCEGYSIASGSDRTKFKFIFVSSKYPIRVAVVELPFAAISLGSDQYRAGLKRFSECLEQDRWPSIWDGETELDIPQYAYVEEDK